ncbi:aspartyl-phosphate phosphatase Spo0E family protein [Clostridium algidicarnis]|uniref:aspartyl-phosphate phosphatase Spo0E family protein n=1 Tax=Clostridium algidicarnis TaxID=37659 RepID=UPI001C0CE85E|nr:aspartyl-phosphate phosphatase Spo0E family protein [Clostridium algidicarnis]MBU3194537.1 aspartyl-phosphate phosphatase Spo0E family protein [Clostridium algidicarnis]MBU3206861.1 aspartyl-phosphate phosphatase Spo0E family protein [Clostridium algidicarnis]
MEKDILEDKIESLKNDLYKLLSTKKPTDSCVVECSETLDKLIVKYYKYLD